MENIGDACVHIGFQSPLLNVLQQQNNIINDRKEACYMPRAVRLDRKMRRRGWNKVIIKRRKVYSDNCCCYYYYYVSSTYIRPCFLSTHNSPKYLLFHPSTLTYIFMRLYPDPCRYMHWRETRINHFSATDGKLNWYNVILVNDDAIRFYLWNTCWPN